MHIQTTMIFLDQVKGSQIAKSRRTTTSIPRVSFSKQDNNFHRNVVHQVKVVPTANYPSQFRPLASSFPSKYLQPRNPDMRHQSPPPPLAVWTQNLNREKSSLALVVAIPVGLVRLLLEDASRAVVEDVDDGGVGAPAHRHSTIREQRVDTLESEASCEYRGFSK